MKHYALVLLWLVFPGVAAFAASWEPPAGKGEWRSPGGEVTLTLVKHKEKGGPRYRLQLRRSGENPSWIGEPKPEQWIDPSWAGLAWLESAPHAWSGGRLFFQEGLLIAILDVGQGAFLVNHQTEFCQKIGELRWLYVADRGKNTFVSTDTLGIIGEGAFQKNNVRLPGGPEDPLVINRVGKSLDLRGLLLAPPMVDKETISLLVMEGDTGVRLLQLDLDSLKPISTREVTAKIPDAKALIESTKDGSIPEQGKAVLESLLSESNGG